MRKILGTLLVLFPLLSGPAAAQDAKTILQAAVRAMGTDTLKCVTYSGTGGFVALVGQNFSPSDDWPSVELASFSRNINYDAKSMREEQTRRQGRYPARGGGGMPIQGDQQLVNFVSGNAAWDMQGTNVSPRPGEVDARQLEIWLDPHGFLKGAMMAKDLVGFDRWEHGDQHREVLAYTVGKFTIQGSIDPVTHHVDRVSSFVPNPLLGDMNVEKNYENYKQFGTVWFPANFHHHVNWDHEHRPQGFFGVTDGGHNSFEIKNLTVQPNACGDPITVPAAAQNATVPPVRVEAQKLADGVYDLAGGSHNSIAVEFADFVTVVEAPQNEARSLAVIAEVKKLFPNKRIKYVVNTHHHFDHSGGLRTYVHEGAIPIAHREIVPYYYYSVMDLSPRKLDPDRLSQYPPDEVAETFVLEQVENDEYAISDGKRTMMLYLVEGNPHATGMLMAYLPAERILIEADLFNPPPAGTPAPAKPSGSAMSLYNNVQRLKLQVDRIAPLHGRVVPWSDFLTFVGKPATP